MRATRTLPLRLAAVEGEALDSWLEAVAAQLRTPIGHLLVTVGLHPPDTAPPNWSRWQVHLRPDQVEHLSAVTGLTPSRLHQMTLAHFHQRALIIDWARGNVDPMWLWGRGCGAGSRFCPDCLAESAGRWQLSWRLGWSFACLTHRRLLADFCPGCRARQRQHPHAARRIPAPGRCPRPGPGTGATRPACGHPLPETDTLTLTPGHPALLAQQHLQQIIADNVARFGVYATDPQPAMAALADLRGIAARVLVHMSDDRMRSLVPDDIVRAHRHTVEHIAPTHDAGRYQYAPRQPGTAAPAYAATAAAAITAAWTIMSQPDCHTAGAPMRELLTALADNGVDTTPTLVRAWGRRTSPRLEAVHLAALATSLRPTDQLRYRTATPSPGSPTSSLAQVARRATKIPGLIWPLWTMRLSPGPEVRHLRAALAASLLVVDSRTELPPAVAQLGAIIDQPITTHVLQTLREEPAWNGIQLALIRLGAYLDTHEVPIDYARRRRLNYTSLLPEHEWIDICKTLLLPPGAGSRHGMARCLLFERISGLPYRCLPDAPRGATSFRGRLARFRFHQSVDLQRELDRAGIVFLAHQGVHDEPLTWQPPADLLDGLVLPGDPPERLDLDQIHRRLEAGHAPSDVARDLETNLLTLRHLVEEHPLPSQGLASHDPHTTGRGLLGLHIAARKLPKARFTHLYQEQHLSFVTIAGQTGIDRKTLAALADLYGIPRHGPASGGTGKHPWLRHQLVEERRSRTDLAAEAGVCLSTITRWARQHGISTKGQPPLPRPASHFRSVARIIKPALELPAGPRRLRTLLATAGHTTLTAACQKLGLLPSTVTTHIQRLEQDLGGQLLIRAQRGQPMRLTPFGRKVVQAATAAVHLLGSEEADRVETPSRLRRPRARQ